MGKNYDYQVWNTDMHTTCSCASLVYNFDRTSLCVPAQRFFLYIVNRFINKNMYYENRLQIKS